ncbi:FGGY-family carbohydrate kinase [Pectinatus haikarae]|uniref:FGGY-family carbohydrate kinase n=1 Tax=Pectinatus haikarae TaxID=349096 RepID=UPI0018C5CA73|nr:FGGY-family carbohydrate kinase [Pectinatus haikarae]
MGYLMGIDVGSTNYKVIACDYDGNFLSVSTRPGNTVYKENGWAELDPQKMWENIAACIKDVSDALSEDKCVGIGVAANGEDVLLDEAGYPVHPTIRWFDTRTDKIAEEWGRFGVDKVYDITGINPNPVAGITKLQWIMKNRPEVMKKAKYYIQIQGFISYKLTGTAKTSWTNACRTMAFDLRKRQWSEEIIEASGLPREIFVDPIRPGELVGCTTKKIKDITGLPEGTPVYAGGIDYACGTFATGIIKSGQMLDSTGTSEQIVAIVDEPKNDPEFIGKNFTSVSYVVDDKYYIMGMIVSSGGIFEWFKKEFKCASFEELIEEAEKQPIGSNGCMLMPYFSGRYSLGSDPCARGAFLGVTRASKRGDFVRAILEGLCFEMHSIIIEIEKMSGKNIDSIYAIGGATKSDFWLQMKADVTGIPVKSKQVPEAAALGAAMLAGLGAGIYKNSEDAVSKVAFPEKIYSPDAEKHIRYMQLYESLNSKMYPALIEFNKKVTEIQTKFLSLRRNL